MAERPSRQRVRIGLAAGRALRCFLPVTLICGPAPSLGSHRGRHAYGLGLPGLWIAAGFALVAPSLFVGMMWFVCCRRSAPLKSRGVLGSCRRSAELTRGHRWKIFGIFICVADGALSDHPARAGRGLYSAATARRFILRSLYVQFRPIFPSFSVMHRQSSSIRPSAPPRKGRPSRPLLRYSPSARW